jgi:FAD/FMN-containing dehydrogenase
MALVSSDVVQRLRDLLGPQGSTGEISEIAPHLTELRGRWRGETPLLLKPASTEQVSAILKICHETRTPIVPQGGNTGLVGGQIPTRGELLLSLERMNKIGEVHPGDASLEAEAGAILRDVQVAADAASMYFALSLAAEGSCTIGGNLSTNAGGVNVLRYGMVRHLVLGLEVVLADGSILEMMRGLQKDNTGYDLKQLFIGAEGTLGIITRARLKIYLKNHHHLTGFVKLLTIDDALPLLHRLQAASGGSVTAFELVPGEAIDLVTLHIPGIQAPFADHSGWSVLFEISTPSRQGQDEEIETILSASLEDGAITDAVIAKNEKERQDLWRLRETIPEAQRKAGPSISNDISVQPSNIPLLIDRAYAAIEQVLPGARPFSFGHVGDGNIHLAVRAPESRDAELLARREEIETAINDEVYRLGGSISAEHGLGIAKNNSIARYKSPEEIAVMRSLKAALDPRNILNPGKVLPDA